MTTACGKPGYLELTGVWPLKQYRVRRVAAIFVAISPPIACAFLASEFGRWDLFERSGSITTAIGLLLASRRYIRYSVLELAVLQAQPKSSVVEILEDIFTANLDWRSPHSGRSFGDGGSISAGRASPTCWYGHCLPLATSVAICVTALFMARDNTPPAAFCCEGVPPAKIAARQSFPLGAGYSSVSFFAPHAGYSSRKDALGPADESRDLVGSICGSAGAGDSISHDAAFRGGAVRAPRRPLRVRGKGRGIVAGTAQTQRVTQPISGAQST